MKLASHCESACTDLTDQPPAKSLLPNKTKYPATELETQPTLTLALISSTMIEDTYSVTVISRMKF